MPLQIRIIALSSTNSRSDDLASELVVKLPVIQWSWEVTSPRPKCDEFSNASTSDARNTAVSLSTPQSIILTQMRRPIVAAKSSICFEVRLCSCNYLNSCEKEINSAHSHMSVGTQDNRTWKVIPGSLILTLLGCGHHLRFLHERRTSKWYTAFEINSHQGLVKCHQ